MNTYTSDYLVIGAGLTGLTAALALARSGRVHLVTKDTLLDSSSALAQGGIAFALADDDSPERHLRDTLRAGCCYNTLRPTRLLVKSALRAFRHLQGLGIAFDRRGDSQEIDLTREGCHSRRRVAHVGGDQTGWHVCVTLAELVRAEPNITLFENTCVLELALEHHCCRGCFALQDGQALQFSAATTLLAAGGFSGLYPASTAHQTNTGDGLVLGFMAGAALKDLEFVQFHPTVLADRRAGGFLVSEALRGEGARLVNERGEAVMRGHPFGDLASRDVVSRAIVAAMAETGSENVYLDCSALTPDYFDQRFPGIAGKCRELGLRPFEQGIPVHPAAHYTIGGLAADTNGKTSIPHLIAAGEAAATGVHGANRLASNSLLECIVFGLRAAETMKKQQSQPVRPQPWPESLQDLSECAARPTSERLAVIRQQVQQITRDQLGILRSIPNLRQAVDILTARRQELAEAAPPSIELLQVRSQVTAAWLLAQAALRRRQSLGCHAIQGRNGSYASRA